MKGGVRWWNSGSACVGLHFLHDSCDFCCQSLVDGRPSVGTGEWQLCASSPSEILPKRAGHLRHIFFFYHKLWNERVWYVPQELSQILPFALENSPLQSEKPFYSTHLVNSSLHAHDKWKRSTAEQSTVYGAILPCFKFWHLPFTLYPCFNLLAWWMQSKFFIEIIAVVFVVSDLFHQVLSDYLLPYLLQPASGISQARILEWVATRVGLDPLEVGLFTRGPSRPRDWTWISCTGKQILYHWATQEAHTNAQYMVVNMIMMILLCPDKHFLLSPLF